MSVQNTNFTVSEIDSIYKKARNVFFIGIGGISISAIAHLCHLDGKKIFGYDRERGENMPRLEGFCHIKYCSSTDNVEGMDLVIYTGAIDESNIEYSHAKKRGIPVISRANFLGYLMTKYEHRVGISGMHGKSTTTAMLSHIYRVAARAPTTLCGAKMIGENSHFIIGDKDYFIFEGCEYLDSFLSFYPTTVGITNLDLDHPDYFKSLNDVVSSFQKYIDKADLVFLNGDDPLSGQLRHKNPIYYGLDSKNLYHAKNINRKKNSFFAYRGEDFIGEITLLQNGEHFIYDALLALAISIEDNIPQNTVCYALSSFKGTKRRMEYLGALQSGCNVYEDYAHHPREIEASLASLADLGFKRIMCIFQPHTYSRTYYLKEQFASAFSKSQKTVIIPTFSAREKNIFDFDDGRLASLIGGEYISDFSKIPHSVADFNPDALVIMGAGDIYKIKGLFPIF